MSSDAPFDVSDPALRIRALPECKTVVLLHQSKILHYRVAVYNRLSGYLRAHGWRLVVVSEGIASHCPHQVAFELQTANGTTYGVLGAVRALRPRVVILFVNLKHSYLFPVLALCKLTGIRTIYWGHGIDLENKQARVKNLAYRIEHTLCDALILYADWLRIYVSRRHAHKVFVANNTIDTSILPTVSVTKHQLRCQLGIRTKRNVICVGRLQRRKRIDLLIESFRRLPFADIGLILVGPDTDGVLTGVVDKRIVWVGPKYGTELAQYMQVADVYCMPGHVGLSIVDAMHYGLPFVTTAVDHAPEIEYLKVGETGFIVAPDAPDALAEALGRLLYDETLCRRMGERAVEIVSSEASLPRMFSGFVAALHYVEAPGSTTSAVGHEPLGVVTRSEHDGLAPSLSLDRAVFVAWKAQCFRSEATAATFHAGLHLLGGSAGTSLWRKLAHYVMRTIETTRLLRRERPRTVICINQPPLLPFLALLYARGRGGNMVMDFHSGALSHARWRLFRPLYRWMARRSALTICHNAQDRDAVAAWGAKVALLPTLPQAMPERSDVPFAVERPHFVFVCSFADDEPVDEALAALAACTECSFNITGNFARRHIDPRRFPSHMRFTGFLNYKTYLEALVNSAAVLTLSKRTNIMQMAVEEAISLGLPVVTNYSGTLQQALGDAAVYVELRADSIAAGLRHAWAEQTGLRKAARETRAARWQDVSGELARIASLHPTLLRGPACET